MGRSLLNNQDKSSYFEDVPGSAGGAQASLRTFGSGKGNVVVIGSRRNPCIQTSRSNWLVLRFKRLAVSITDRISGRN